MKLYVDKFDAIDAFTLKWERGFSNNPADPGGATQDGTTLYDLRRWFPSATVADLKKLTFNLRKAIARTDYWDPIHGYDLWPGLDLSVYDEGYNCGVGTSAKMLQTILKVGVDGDIGDETLTAANKVTGRIQRLSLLSQLNMAQSTYYRTRPGFPTFGKGWLNRLNDRYKTALQMLGDAP